MRDERQLQGYMNYKSYKGEGVKREGGGVRRETVETVPFSATGAHTSLKRGVNEQGTRFSRL
jgi:hypothetical protein